MKKLVLLSGCMILVFSFISVPVFSEEDTTCPKSKMGQAMITEKHCAKAEQCHKSQEPTNDMPGHQCCRMQGSSQIDQMSGMMPMRSAVPSSFPVGEVRPSGNSYFSSVVL